MDKCKDDNDKDEKYAQETDIANATQIKHNEYDIEESDGAHKGTKRPAEVSLVAPKPKIKKKLHTVISELKTSKEVPNPFSVAEGQLGSTNSSQNSNQHDAFHENLFYSGANFNVESSNVLVDANTSSIGGDNYFHLSKQYSICDNANNCENIYNRRLSDNFAASASPKVKCKSRYEYSEKSVSPHLEPVIEQEDESYICSSNKLKLSSDQESNAEDGELATVEDYRCDTNLSLSPHELQREPNTKESDEDISKIEFTDNSNKSEELESIPASKEYPLVEPIISSDEDQIENDSDKSAKARSDGDNNDSDCDDVNKESLMGGVTGLSARPKVKNMRKNIRDIIADDKLEEDTLAAQKEEQLRLQRLQEKRVAMREYLEQQQVERLVAEVAEAAEAVSAAEAVQEVEADLCPAEPIMEIKKEVLERDNDIVVLSSEDSDSKDSEPEEGVNTETKPLLKPKLEVKSEEESESETEDSESDSDSDVVVLSASEEDADVDEDVNNSGSHVNDEFNVADVHGRLLVNVGHPEKEEDIFLAPQLAAAVKPHQIGGLRFLYDNIVESVEQFKTSNGFGCILAHSMGLGKTLQVISLTDVFLRHTGSKSVLIIVPINTLQNWLTEYNHWLPDEIPAGLLEGTEFRPRNFKVFLMNDAHKNMKSRAKVIDDWYKQGGVLLMGYEIYRQLSLKKPKKPKRKKKKNMNEIVDIEEEDSNKEYLDEIHKALVRPGPDLVICDEGHRIKNAHANISQALKSIRTRRRIVLTGYPLQNNLLEYWCMVDFVRPNYLGTKTEFSNMFERPIQNGQCVDSTPQDVKLMRYRAHVLHALLEGFVQRRGHSVLAATLPQKHEHVILCRLTPIQRKLYSAYMTELTFNKGMANPLKAFAICCKIWNHPDILYNLVMKRLNQDLDLDLDEVVGKPGAKTKKAVAPRGGDKRKGGKPTASSWNSPTESVVPANKLPTKKQNLDLTVNTQQAFQPNAMGPPQMMTQRQGCLPQISSQQQRIPMSNNPNDHSNVNIGYPYPNMYNVQAPVPYMNQMQYSWGYNQTFPPDNNAQYMPPYHMYPPQYPHSVHQNQQQDTPPYVMQPPGHIGGMTPSNLVCSQPLHDQNLSQEQINANEHIENQNGGMTEQHMESMEPTSLGEEQNSIIERSQIMSLPHSQNNVSNLHMEQNNVNLGQDRRPGTGGPILIPDGNCKYNYMPSPPKISDQMKNLALENKDFMPPIRHMQEDYKVQVQCPNMHPGVAGKLEMGNFERSQESNDKSDTSEEKKDDCRKDECKKDELSLEWAEAYFKEYVPGQLVTSTKFQLFFKILEGSLAVGDRVLVFSQSLFTLSQLEEFLQKTFIFDTEEKWAKNRSYYRLDGSTPAQERDKLISDFNVNPNIRVFLVSTRAGSLGINLVGANRVVVFDASFNPCHDTQAVCRVYRYGQRKDCHIYRMVTDNSLERRIYDRQVNKQGISDRIVDEMNPDAHLSSKEISNLLVENEEEPGDVDFTDKTDGFSDPIFKEIVNNKSHLITRPPFRHESLLVDRKDKKLSNAEKRLAKRSYELEKQANISYNRPSYSSFYPKTAGVQTALASRMGGVLYTKPVGGIRQMQADARQRVRVEGGIVHRPNILSRSSNTPVESLAKQGVSVQQITLPKDVSIPTNSGDAKPIQLKGGQSVMVIKTQKGMYLRLSDGKIVAIRIPPGNEDAFGLPLSQGSVTIVPTAYPSRGRSGGVGRGPTGSTIRRGRPPLSAQYALGQVIPKGINSQMAVRIMRKAVPANRCNKATFQSVTVPVSNQGTLLNKSVVITPAKSSQKAAKRTKMAPRIQITPVLSKARGLASIGGTSGLNRRLNRNNKLLFQQASFAKSEDDKKQAMLKSGSPSEEDDSSTSSTELPNVTEPPLSFGANEKPDNEKTDIMSSLDVTKAEKYPAMGEKPLLVGSPLNNESSLLEKKVSIPSISTIFSPLTSISNPQSDPVPESMLNPLSQLSNLLPPDERDAEDQLSSNYNAVPQNSQTVYSNPQLFQPYLQQTITSSAGTSHATHQLSNTSTSDALKPWPKMDGLPINSIDHVHGMSNLKSGFIPPSNTSRYQSSHLEPHINKLSRPTAYPEGTQISQTGSGDQRSLEEDSTTEISKMLNQPNPSSSDSPLSLSNLLPETAPSEIPISPSSSLDYMNYASAFRRLEYPTSEVPSLLQTTTTSEMGSPAPPPYSTTVATTSSGYPGHNPPPYSQYPAYSNHSFRAQTINPPGYPYGNQFSPYGHYGGLSPAAGPQPPPPPQQYAGNQNQENFNYNSGNMTSYPPGTANFGQGPYPPV